MLNVSNIGLFRYKTPKVAAMNSIQQIVLFFLTHQVSPSDAQDHNVLASVCLSVVGAVDNVYGQRKSAACLLVIQPL
jgi:predicted metal-dependent HD superfamily phosphohydrolase